MVAKACVYPNRIVIAGQDSAQDSVNQVGQEMTRRNMNIQPTQRIIEITNAGDQGLIALRACQAYAKEVSTPK